MASAFSGYTEVQWTTGVSPPPAAPVISSPGGATCNSPGRQTWVTRHKSVTIVISSGINKKEYVRV
jgi:hypothetical protein